MYKEIYLDAPSVGDLEKRYLNKAIDMGYVSTIGPFVREFEEKFARYLNINSAVSTQSGTAALHMALYELGIGPGDEVIVPALTFVATVNPVMYVGAKPVFADVDLRTWNIAPEEIEKTFTKRTRAIIPVHFYGNPCAMDVIKKIARRHGLYVIEDATESIGATYKGRLTGTFGDLGCFSFNGNKVITAGGGGMVVGNDRKRICHIKFLVNQARVESKGYFHPEIGFNYRMTNIEAALALAQMKRLEAFLSRKRRFRKIYEDAIRGLGSIEFQEAYEGGASSFWFTCITTGAKSHVALLQKRMKEKGMPSRRVFMPVTEFPPYRIYKDDDYKNSYHIYEHGLCLPGSTLNSDDDIYRVCDVLRKALKKI